MTLHAPVHHLGFADHTLLRDVLLAILLGIGLALILILAPLVQFRFTPPMSMEQQSLIDFRASERADWAAGVGLEGPALIEFRASEREGR